MKILVIVPVPVTDVDLVKMVQDAYEPVKDHDTELEVVCMDQGVESVETHFATDLMLSHIAEKIDRLDEEKYDGVVMFCADDPGVYGAKERLRIPVVGLMEPALHLACMLGRRFSYLSALESTIPMTEHMMQLYEMRSRCASIRSIDIPAVQLRANRDKMIERLLEEGRKAIKEDGADVLILGCGNMVGVTSELSDKLAVPVIDPAIVGLKTCELLIKLKLSQSKRAFPPFRSTMKRILPMAN
ncbi:MAG: aspartate/glutamate racemase family protein [Candidatus Bathyarchaeia archaeon]|jgi:allantoin racemase